MNDTDDITQYAVADTAPLHLKDARGEPMYNAKGEPRRIHLYSPGSKPYAALESRQSARALKRMQDNDGKITAAPAEERVEQTAEDLAAITVRFENISYPPAGDAEGVALFEALYRDPKLGFITRQVSKFASDWGNFAGGSNEG